MPHSNLFWRARFAKGPKIDHCEICDNLQNTVARVFPSRQAFEESEFYGGEDLCKNDEFATHAVWPGKNNIGRAQADYWLAVPMHPHCGCEFLEHTPAHEAVKYVDWFSDLSDAELKGAA